MVVTSGAHVHPFAEPQVHRVDGRHPVFERGGDIQVCLLYTSDAADERSSVDLGGRRIIKKKNIEAPVAQPGI